MDLADLNQQIKNIPRPDALLPAAHLRPPEPYMDPMLDHMREMADRAAKMTDAAEVTRANTASKLHALLFERIRTFDEQLDEAHEVGARLVSFGESVTFSIESIGYDDPSLIYFVGTTPDGQRVELMQNINQISVLLMAMPRAEPEEPKEPFGFNPR